MGRAKTCLATAAVGLMASGCGSEQPGPRSVVLLTIDTLRADRLQFHGYERPTSPFIDTLAAESTVFEGAMATSPPRRPRWRRS